MKVVLLPGSHHVPEGSAQLQARVQSSDGVFLQLDSPRFGPVLSPSPTSPHLDSSENIENVGSAGTRLLLSASAPSPLKPCHPVQ